MRDVVIFGVATDVLCTDRGGTPGSGSCCDATCPWSRRLARAGAG